MANHDSHGYGNNDEGILAFATGYPQAMQQGHWKETAAFGWTWDSECHEVMGVVANRKRNFGLSGLGVGRDRDWELFFLVKRCFSQNLTVGTNFLQGFCCSHKQQPCCLIWFCRQIHRTRRTLQK